jgi:hypothetical protein
MMRRDALDLAWGAMRIVKTETAMTRVPRSDRKPLRARRPTYGKRPGKPRRPYLHAGVQGLRRYRRCAPRTASKPAIIIRSDIGTVYVHPALYEQLIANTQPAPAREESGNVLFRGRLW